MTSLAKAAVSRLNGLLSTGPRTAEGKAVAARNAVTHGIFAVVPVITGEDAGAWEAHRAGVVAALTPAGLLEVTLAERVASVLWRLRRLTKYEVATTAAAVEDAGLPAPEADPFVLALGSRVVDREQHVTLAANQLRDSREHLAAVTETAVLVRRLAAGGGDAPVPRELAEAALGWAFGAAFECHLRKFDPEHHTSPGFPSALGLAGVGPRDVPWTIGLLARAFGYYASAVGREAGVFLGDVLAAVEGRVAGLRREVDWLTAEVAGLTRRLEVWRDRAAAAALLPPADVVERVAKYEKHLNSQLTSTLHELERLRALRRGDDLPPPVVADVSVTVRHDPG